MARPCSICIHPQKKAIETAHKKNETNRRIAAQYDLSEASVRRHFASHAQNATQEPKASDTHAIGKRPQGHSITGDERQTVQEAFLAAFVLHGIITRACKEAGVNRSTIRQWEEDDLSFSPRYAEAKEAVNDIYRDEARRRAVEGTESYVVNQGKLVYDPETGRPLIEHKYSDTLIQFLMKAKMPEYKEKQQLELTGKDGGPIQIEQWVTLRKTIFQALAPFPDARAAVAQAIAQTSSTYELGT